MLNREAHADSAGSDQEQRDNPQDALLKRTKFRWFQHSKIFSSTDQHRSNIRRETVAVPNAFGIALFYPNHV